MSVGNAIEVEGVIVGVLPSSLYEARLANGHKLLAYVAGRRRKEYKFAPGDKVILQMSFFDLSEGRIKTKS